MFAAALIAAGVSAAPFDFSAATVHLSSNAASYSGGVIVIVEQDDQEIFRFEDGALTETTRRALASASKWISAALLLRVVETGVVTLDDPVGDWLPEMAANGKGAVTLRQCFAMTSGLVESAKDYELNTGLTLAESVRQIATNTPLLHAPGAALYYEGDGMQVAGRVCEVAMGEDFRMLAENLVFAPLGMTNCDYQVFDTNPAVPGGARGTARAYLRFLATIQNGGFAPDGTRFLEPHHVALFFTNQTGALPELFSPWPVATFPYGKRPDYGCGSWILAETEEGVVEEVCSPGAFGTFPWIDRRRNIRGVILNFQTGGFMRTVGINLQLMELLRAEIDRVTPNPSSGGGSTGGSSGSSAGSTGSGESSGYGSGGTDASAAGESTGTGGVDGTSAGGTDGTTTSAAGGTGGTTSGDALSGGGSATGGSAAFERPLIAGWTIEITKPTGNKPARLRDGALRKVKGRVITMAPNSLPPGRSSPLAVEMSVVPASATGASLWHPSGKIGRVNRKGIATFSAKGIGSNLVAGSGLRILARASTNFALASSATAQMETVLRTMK